MDAAEQVEVEPDQCVALLRTQGFGRIIFDDGGPQVRPVNYTVVAEQILIRMDRAFEDDSRVLFEIDGVDTVRKEGWSVIVEGSALSTPFESCDEDPIEPWAPGEKGWSTTITIESVSGRWVKSQRPTSLHDGRGYV